MHAYKVEQSFYLTDKSRHEKHVIIKCSECGVLGFCPNKEAVSPPDPGILLAQNDYRPYK